MNERVTDPADDPIVLRLRVGETLDTEDGVTLKGRVVHGRPGFRRIYPDNDVQRWLEIANGEIVDSFPADGGLTALVVRRHYMNDPMFSEGVLEAMESNFLNGWMSTWSLIPDSRYVAAQLLDLIPEEYS